MKITEINGNDLTVMQGESGEVIIVNPDIFQDATYSEMEDDVKERVIYDFITIDKADYKVIGKRTIAYGFYFRFEFEESADQFDHIKAFDLNNFAGDCFSLAEAFKDAILEVEGFDNVIVKIFQHEDGSYSTGNCQEENLNDNISFEDNAIEIGHVHEWSVNDYAFGVNSEYLSDRKKALKVFLSHGADWYKKFLETFNLN